MSCRCGHGPWHHWGHGYCYGYGPGYGYGSPPGQPYPRSARRGKRARELEDYVQDLEEELAHVRRELQELRDTETRES